MPRYLRRSVAVAAACLLVSGCGLLDSFKDKESPTEPGPPVSIDGFAGAWSSSTASTPITGCGTVKYTVVPVDASNANVTFEGTCAGTIRLTGSGTGKVTGSTLEWSAQGVVAQGSVNCPFTFANGKATSESATTMKVDYAGTVCGIPVSGSEVVKK